MCNMLQLEYVIDIGNANKPDKIDFWENSAIEMPMYMYPNGMYLSSSDFRNLILVSNITRPKWVNQTFNFD